jgi:hypothetical protein
MRDLETIRLALTGAETGHLVFGTLHTSSAAKTIDRVVDVFPAAEKEMVRSMLSESLRAVISQTLLKRKDGSGRVAAHEIMIGTPAIRNLIRENKVAQMYSAIQTGQAQGMQTLDQALMELGARVCTSRSPRCEQCPLRAVCRSVGTKGIVRRRGERFAGSRRYFRGRIVAALRLAPAGMPLHALRELVGDPGSTRGELVLEQLVEGLARDGLVEVREEGGEYIVRLPGQSADQGEGRGSNAESGGSPMRVEGSADGR